MSGQRPSWDRGSPRGSPDRLAFLTDSRCCRALGEALT